MMSRSFLGMELGDFLKVPTVRWLQRLSVLQWTLTFFFLGTFCTIIFLFLFMTPFAFLPALYVIWFVYDFKTPERGGRPSSWIRGWSIWKLCRDYFPMKLIKTADLDPTRNYLLLYHPHGIMSYGAFVCFSTAAANFTQKFPGLRSTLVSLKVNFLFPFYRDYGMALGICSCSKDSIEWLLTKEGPGNAVVLVVGGAGEALEARPGSFNLSLSRRKGFVRIALTTGTSLVPVFAFGENDLYDQWTNPSGSPLRRFQMAMTKLLSFSLPVFHGRGIFNPKFGILPYAKPVNVVVGHPIHVPRIPEPTEEDVDELHRNYIEHLKELFESEKSKYGIPDTQHLNII